MKNKGKSYVAPGRGKSRPTISPRQKPPTTKKDHARCQVKISPSSLTRSMLNRAEAFTETSFDIFTRLSQRNLIIISLSLFWVPNSHIPRKNIYKTISFTSHLYSSFISGDTNKRLFWGNLKHISFFSSQLFKL